MEHTQAGVAAPESVGTVVRAAMQSTVRNREADAEARLRAAVDASVNGAALVADAVKEAVRVVGPTNFETRCGFKVRGRKVVDAVIGPAGMLRVFPDTRQGIVVHSTQPAASVLIEFEGGVGIVLPAIQDFIGELTFANDDLIGVAYEPSDNSTRWPDYAAYAARFRTLRALAGSSVRLGVFRLEHEDAGHLATLFANAKSTDPVLALYAAYSYHELHQAGRLADVYFYTQGDLNTTFFDIAMLAGKLGEGAGHGPPDVFPSFPLLAQGWALLSPKRITLPAALSGLRSHLVPSLWSVFDAAGVAILRAAIQSGSMR
jgi:hypothetical protein